MRRRAPRPRWFGRSCSKPQVTQVGADWVFILNRGRGCHRRRRRRMRRRRPAAPSFFFFSTFVQPFARLFPSFRFFNLFFVFLVAFVIFRFDENLNFSRGSQDSPIYWRGFPLAFQRKRKRPLFSARSHVSDCWLAS